MTEADWLARNDPDAMLDYLRGRASNRKLRLFAAACCRELRVFFPDPAHPHPPRVRPEAVQLFETLERRADEALSGPWPAAPGDLFLPDDGLDHHRMPWEAVRSAFGDDAWQAARDTARNYFESYATLAASPYFDTDPREYESRYRQLSDFLREVFGNPFRPVSLDPAWLACNDGAVSKLARTIYDERAFDRLPILADALEEAGCADQSVLDHCRSEEPHFRGCWVLDLIVGKE